MSLLNYQLSCHKFSSFASNMLVSAIFDNILPQWFQISFLWNPIIIRIQPDIQHQSAVWLLGFEFRRYPGTVVIRSWAIWIICVSNYNVVSCNMQFLTLQNLAILSLHLMFLNHFTSANDNQVFIFNTLFRAETVL